MLNRNLSLLACFSVLALAAGACGDDDGGGGTPDTGMTMPDGGTGDPDTGGGMDAGSGLVLPTCDAPHMVTGEIGVVTVSGDTTLGMSGPRDLGADCNNPDALRWAPQEVVAYTVPGTGDIGVTFSTAVAGTDSTFDTLVQVRRDCATIPTEIVPTCFDDAAMDEIRTTGTTNAQGGDTIYFIVTGYSETTASGATDRGAWTLSIEAVQNDLPTVTGGEARAIGSRGEIEVTGEDPQMDVVAFRVSFVDDTGMPVDMDFDGDGTLDGNTFADAWDSDISGMSPFTTFNEYDGLGDAISGATPSVPTNAEIELIDGFWAFGDAVSIPVVELNEVGLGATCDAMNRCARTLMCETTSNTCVATPEITAACAAATPITIATPTDTTTTATVMGTLDSGTGPFQAPCAYAGAPPDAGPENLYSLDVPAGTFDLLIRTNLPGTGDTDTVVWARSTCADPLTTVGCNDDIDTPGGVYQSQFEAMDVTMGTHVIFVEQWAGGTMSGAPFAMEVSLRPVLASGATCDMTGANNRCAGGACAGGTCP